MRKTKIAFYDAKEYDKQSFMASNINEEFDIAYYETRLNKDTCKLAEGCDVVCIFVNDDVNPEVIDQLKENGVKLIALRCAGYNNVDIEYAYGKIHIVRVPAYSPYAVAEHAMALLLTSIRRIHKGYIRTRDFNFSLNGLTGFDLHGKTVGVIGTADTRHQGLCKRRKHCKDEKRSCFNQYLKRRPDRFGGSSGRNKSKTNRRSVSRCIRRRIKCVLP